MFVRNPFDSQWDHHHYSHHHHHHHHHRCQFLLMLFMTVIMIIMIIEVSCFFFNLYQGRCLVRLLPDTYDPSVHPSALQDFE